jgi:hypothetical protein
VVDQTDPAHCSANPVATPDWFRYPPTATQAVLLLQEMLARVPFRTSGFGVLLTDQHEAAAVGLIAHTASATTTVMLSDPAIRALVIETPSWRRGSYQRAVRFAEPARIWTVSNSAF